MNETFYWKNLPITLSIQNVPIGDNRLAFYGKIFHDQVLIASIESIYHEKKLKIIYFANHLQTNLQTRLIFDFEKRILFKYIGAWLLQQLILFVFSSNKCQTEINISLIVDGFREGKEIDHEKLVCYYEKIGFYREDDKELTIMYAKANTVVEKIKLLLS